MQKRKRQPPTYRQRTGYDQAIVTLTDSVTGYRKDNRLGPYGSPESRESDHHHRVPAQPESGGRHRPASAQIVVRRDDGATVSSESVACGQGSEGPARTTGRLQGCAYPGHLSLFSYPFLRHKGTLGGARGPARD